jgi:hypothetical protein
MLTFSSKSTCHHGKASRGVLMVCEHVSSFPSTALDASWGPADLCPVIWVACRLYEAEYSKTQSRKFRWIRRFLSISLGKTNSWKLFVDEHFEQKKWNERRKGQHIGSVWTSFKVGGSLELFGLKSRVIPVACILYETECPKHNPLKGDGTCAFTSSEQANEVRFSLGSLL